MFVKIIQEAAWVDASSFSEDSPDDTIPNAGESTCYHFGSFNIMAQANET
jgi:hypothetical protein